MEPEAFDRGLRALGDLFGQGAPRRFDPTPVLEAHPGLSQAVGDLLIQSVAAISEGREPEAELSALIEGIPARRLYPFFIRLLTRVAPVTWVPIPQDEVPAGAAEAHAIAPEALEALFHSAVDDKVPLRDYHRQLLTRGGFDFPDHRTGKPRRVTASLLVIADSPARVRSMTFYATTGADGFMCLEQPLVGGLAALFIPSRNLFIGTRRQQTALPVKLLRAHMLATASLTAAHLREGRRRLALLIGGSEHIGHTLLNEYSALDRCVRTGLHERLRVIMRGWVGFLPQAEFLPELRDRLVLSVRSQDEAYRRVVEGRLLVVRPTRGHMWISPGLVDRLTALEDRLDVGIREAASHEGPTVWFELRSNDRIWSGQREGIPNVANALAVDWPGLRIILSGWSQPGDAVSRPYDEGAIARDRELAASIKARLEPGVSVVDLTGLPTQVKLLWARRIDAYAAVYSSGFIFPYAIGRKPGVIFCNTHFTNKLLGGEHDHLIDLQPFPVQLFILRPSTIRTKDDEAELWDANFDFDWTHLHHALDWVLREARMPCDNTADAPYASPPSIMARIAFEHPPEARMVDGKALAGPGDI